jgi:chromosome segregation ATPase
MEHSQLSQMVTWLDQARQSDRAVIEQLREQVENLAGSRDETAKYSVELESQLASLQADVQSTSRDFGSR